MVWFRRRSRPTAAGQVLSATLSELGLTDQARRLTILSVWRTVVGDRIADNTHPASYSRGVLTVQAATPAWQNELTYMKELLRDKLNTELAGVTVQEIRITTGGHLRTPPPHRPELSTSEGREVDTAAAEIRDPETRSSFAALMAASFGKKLPGAGE